MKKLAIVALIAVIFFNTAVAQDEGEKQQKAETKEQRKKDLKEGKSMYLALARDSSFIIEANSILTNNLNTYQVSPGTNFIKIDGDEFVLQTANNFAHGYNGLGGITITGRILSYEVNEGKENQSLQVIARVMTHLTGHSTLNIYISGDGNASARFVDNRGNRITFNGDAYAIENSSHFEGVTLF